MRTTVRLDDQLLIEAKLHAAETGRTLTRLIEDALREALARRAAQQPGKPFKMKTFGGSGLQPGVNLDSNAALWDLMDEEEWSSPT
jgi:hypothetical protein